MGCNITGTLYNPNGTVLANSGVLFEVLTDGAARTAVHVPYRVQSFFTTDENGLLNADIESPSSGSWLYRMTIHENGATYDFYLSSSATALTIDEVLALAGVAGSEAGTPQGEFLNGLYTAVSGAADGQMLQTESGDLILIDTPQGMPEPGSDGLWARFVASAVGSWLQATAVGAALFAAVDAAAARTTIGAAASAGSGTANELMVSDANGNSVRAGYVASQAASANTVARRTSDGGIAAIGNNSFGIDGRSINSSGVYGESASGSGVSGYAPTTGTGVTGISASGTGGESTSMAGTYHHRFGVKSAIDRVSGILKFIDSTAVSDRAAQRTELGLGTAAVASTADFDAAGAAATAQAAAQAASLQKNSNLGDLVSVATARTNLDIPVQPVTNIRVIGDSIAAGAPVADLEAALARVTADTFAIGGETSGQILSRVQGVSVVRPARGATLSGATDIVVAENVPPRMVDGAYSASWAEYSTQHMLQIDNVLIYNHGKYLGGAIRKKFIGVCNYSTAADTLKIYTEVRGGRTMTPESTFEAYAVGTNVTTLPSFQSLSNYTGAVSSDYAHTGLKSAKMTNSATGAFYFLLKNGTQATSLATTSIYEADIWVYVPVAFANVSQTFGPALVEEIVWLDGTSPVNLATDVGTWKRLHFLFKLPTGTVYLFMYSDSTGDVGKSIYIDDMRVIERYESAGIAPVANDTLYTKLVEGGATGYPSGLSQYRRYYVSSPSPTSTKLSLTSGGAAVDIGEDAVIEMYEAFHLSWTPVAPDTTTHYLTAKAYSGDYDAFALIWSGHNDLTGSANMIANIEETVNEWKNKHGDRFAVLTLVNRFGYGSSFYHDDWEYVRQWIMSRYPNNYVDCYGAAITWGLAQATSSQDHADAVNGRVPASLLSDGVHPNAQGNAVMFTEPVTEFLLAKGYYVAA